MSRILSLGPTYQSTLLIDKDDFVSGTLNKISILKKLEVGSSVDIDEIHHEIDGSGTNSAITFARFGHESIFLGNIRNDFAGETVLAALDKEGVDTSFISIVKEPTGCSVILLNERTLKKTALKCQGANKTLKNLKPSVLEKICPDWLYISSTHGDINTILSFLDKAKKLNCKVMFNPSHLELEQPEKILGLLPEIDIFLINKKEASKLVPGKILAELASHLKNYTETVIITDGSSGGFAINSDEAFRFGIYEDTKIKDLTGAGDAFGSGFLAAFASGKSFKDSLIFASANSTSVIKQIGATKGILSSHEKLHAMPIQKIEN